MELRALLPMSFVIMRLFLHKVSVILNTLLPTLRTTLYNSVAKFIASNLGHITMVTRELQTSCDKASAQFVLTGT
jgi:hypothetical protein